MQDSIELLQILVTDYGVCFCANDKLVPATYLSGKLIKKCIVYSKCDDEKEEKDE